MYSRMLAATTFAVVSALGASVMAMQPESRDVTGVRTNQVTAIPDDVLSFLDGGSFSASAVNVLPEPITDQIIKGVPAPTHQVQYMPQVVQPKAATSTELPLVPLPPSLYTGAAGLIGLGMVRLWGSLLKSLR